MDIQTIVVLAIVAMAAAFIGRRAWNSLQAARKPAKGCTSCGCEGE
jgi:hypothetical protein